LSDPGKVAIRRTGRVHAGPVSGSPQTVSLAAALPQAQRWRRRA